MNEIVNKFLLARDKFMSDLCIVLADRLVKINNEFKNLKKQEIQAIYTKMS